MDHLNFKQVIETADLLDRTLRKLIISERGSHAETLVASSARMAGTMLLRHRLSEAAGYGFDPSATSGEAVRQAPMLVETLFATLCQLGHGELDEQGLGGSGASTALSHLSLDETQAILEPWFRRTLDGSPLSLCEVAASAAMTTALLIHDCRDELDVHAGCAIATEGFVEPSKCLSTTSDPAF